ncbi:MAG: hypothetical protein ABIJ28_02265 [Patescibacteria group bacterium]
MSYGVLIPIKKGILMAAESRGNFYNERGIPVAYYDTVQKIFRINDTIGLVTTGNEFLKGKLLSEVISEFIEQYRSILELEEVIDSLIEFIVSKIKDSDLIRNQIFVVGGYKNEKPVIFYKDNSGINKLQNIQIIKSSNFSSFSMPDYKKVIKYSLNESIKLAIKIIKDFENNGNYPDGIEPRMRVGGPIDLLWLPMNGKGKWIKRKEKIGFDSINDFLEWAKKCNEVKLVNNFTRDELVRVISKLQEEI